MKCYKMLCAASCLCDVRKHALNDIVLEEMQYKNVKRMKFREKLVSDSSLCFELRLVQKLESSKHTVHHSRNFRLSAAFCSR